MQLRPVWSILIWPAAPYSGLRARAVGLVTGFRFERLYNGKKRGTLIIAVKWLLPLLESPFRYSTTRATTDAPFAGKDETYRQTNRQTCDKPIHAGDHVSTCFLLFHLFIKIVMVVRSKHKSDHTCGDATRVLQRNSYALSYFFYQ